MFSVFQRSTFNENGFTSAVRKTVLVSKIPDVLYYVWIGAVCVWSIKKNCSFYRAKVASVEVLLSNIERRRREISWHIQFGQALCAEFYYVLFAAKLCVCVSVLCDCENGILIYSLCPSELLLAGWLESIPTTHTATLKFFIFLNLDIFVVAPCRHHAGIPKFRRHGIDEAADDNRNGFGHSVRWTFLWGRRKVIGNMVWARRECRFA